MLPIDIATQETTKFFERHAKFAGARVLEVGCGDGDLAAHLSTRAAKVVALDKDDRAIDATRKKGVEVQKVDFFHYVPAEKFDVVVFSRSLHHMHPVATAGEKACAVLSPQGRVLVEDFAADMCDEASLEWLRNARAMIPASCLRTHCDHKFPGGSMEEWNEHHFVKHKVAITGDLIDAIKWSFTNVRSEPAPYLYRYLIDQMTPTPESGEHLKLAFDSECKAIAAGKIRSIGFRLIGVRD